ESGRHARPAPLEPLPVRQPPVRTVPDAAAPVPLSPAHAELPGPRSTPAVGEGSYRPVEDDDVHPLPKRSRGMHLAAQLREDTGSVPQVAYDPDSPEAAREMYRGLQAAFDQAEQPGQHNHAGRAEEDPASR
ncbi:MAG: hypothetical protein HOV68_11015, partial [Streptomycetaceae bacterium]|nr:hypothetical protein [Streptomycetaceae bacterium]